MRVIRSWFKWISWRKKKWFARKIRIFHMFLTVFPLFYAQERIAHIAFCSFALFLRATWAIHSLHSLQRSDLITKEWIALSLFRSQNTSDSLKKPISEVPTLTFRDMLTFWNPFLYEMGHIFLFSPLNIGRVFITNISRYKQNYSIRDKDFW